MELKKEIWLINQGLQALAKGEEVKEWQFSLLEPGATMETEGWCKLGVIQVRVPRLPAREEAVCLSVDLLTDLLNRKRAEAEAEQNLILAQISKLQSLTYEEKS